MTIYTDNFDGPCEPKTWTPSSHEIVPPDYVRTRLTSGDVLAWHKAGQAERWFINGVEQFEAVEAR